MYEHIIIIGTSYKLGKRIAWHYSAEEIKNNIISMLMDKINVDNSNYVLHRLTTDSEDWESIVSKDSFYEDLDVYKDLDTFLKVMEEERKVTALDIAKILLSFKSMSNLKLQKMVYLVYANYLLKTKNKLFDNKIVAYPYGPLIEDLYDNYKKHGGKTINENDVEEFEGVPVPLAVSKLLQIGDEDILPSIHYVLENYGERTASQLVDITHLPESPWSQTPRFSQISDEDILKYHHIEQQYVEKRYDLF